MERKAVSSVCAYIVVWKHTTMRPNENVAATGLRSQSDPEKIS